MRVVIASSTGACGRGVVRSGAASRVFAALSVLIRVIISSTAQTGCIGRLLSGARQGRLQMVMKARQLVEILSMRTARAQACCVVAQLALGYSQVSHDLLLPRLSAAQEHPDRAGALKEHLFF